MQKDIFWTLVMSNSLDLLLKIPIVCVQSFLPTTLNISLNLDFVLVIHYFYSATWQPLLLYINHVSSVFLAKSAS